jgi:hypothetical protein
MKIFKLQIFDWRLQITLKIEYLLEKSAIANLKSAITNYKVQNLKSRK